MFRGAMGWAGVVCALAGAFPSAARAADIAMNCTGGTWSNPATWVGGVVPGSGDRAYRTTSCGGTLTLDAAAPDPLGSFIVGLAYGDGSSAFGVSMTLGASTRFSGDLFLREGTINLAGHDLAVDGTLSNCGRLPCTYLDGEGNGLALTRSAGGAVSAGTLWLVRASTAELRAGDTFGAMTLGCMGSPRNSCADVVIRQDPVSHAAGLAEGVTVSTALTASAIGATDALKAQLWLHFDEDLGGGEDWILRVAGDQTTALRALYANNQIVLSTAPTGAPAWDPNVNIYYDADTAYTYVGYPASDTDGDGLTDDVDVCPGVNSADQTDTDGDGFGDLCAHPSAQIDPSVRHHGQYVAAKAVVGAGATLGLGTVIGRRASVGAGAILGSTVTVARAVQIGAGAELGDNVGLGYAAEVGANAVLGAGTLVGNLAELSDDTEVGAGGRIGRGARLLAGPLIGDGAHIGPDATVTGGPAPLFTLENDAKLLRGADVLANARVQAGGRLGREVTLCEGVVVGANAVVRANNTQCTNVPAGATIPRGNTP